MTLQPTVLPGKGSMSFQQMQETSEILLPGTVISLGQINYYKILKIKEK